MVEYVLLTGVNDHEEHTPQLAQLLDSKPMLINLIVSVQPKFNS